MTKPTHDLSFLNDLNLSEYQLRTIHSFITHVLNESEKMKLDLTKSIRLNMHYINALSIISSDVQYLNVASSSRGGENLIHIAKEALRKTFENEKENSE